MRRKEIDELISWKNSDNNKALLLTGAKGVGKTYLAYDFARSFFIKILYINFEIKHAFNNIFKSNDVYEACNHIKKYFGLDSSSISSDKMLLILDEISFCPDAINMLPGIIKTGEFANIIIISSNLDIHSVQSNKTNSYNLDINNFHHIALYPLGFDDFLRAIAKDWYIETIITHYKSNKKIPDIVHKELLALHKLYMKIGGMPSLINEYLSLNSCVNIEEQHNLHISSYYNNINLHFSESKALKMKQVLDSIPYQLMKENKKFQYKLIRKGSTYSMYMDAINALTERNYIIRCNKLSSKQLQSIDIASSNKETINNLSESNNSFKLYMLDTGMLYSKMVEEECGSLSNIKEKSLLENYTAQILQSHGYDLMFWESNSMAKIDFIINKESNLYPIEIHCSNNTRSKCISVFKKVCKFPYSIKISSKNFEYINNVKYIPYYAVFCI